MGVRFRNIPLSELTFWFHEPTRNAKHFCLTMDWTAPEGGVKRVVGRLVSNVRVGRGGGCKSS